MYFHQLSKSAYKCEIRGFMIRNLRYLSVISIVVSFLFASIEFLDSEQVVEETTEEIQQEEIIIAEPECEIELEIEPEIKPETPEEILEKELSELDKIKDNKLEYLIEYKEIWERYLDSFSRPVTIYDVFTEEEIYLMCRCIQTETNGAPFDAKVNVAVVILNRLDSDLYPNKVSEVIVPGQFAFWRTEFEDNTLPALEYAYLFGVEKIKDALYFQSAGDYETFCKREQKYYDGYHWFY